MREYYEQIAEAHEELARANNRLAMLHRQMAAVAADPGTDSRQKTQRVSRKVWFSRINGAMQEIVRHTGVAPEYREAFTYAGCPESTAYSSHPDWCEFRDQFERLAGSLSGELVRGTRNKTGEVERTPLRLREFSE